MSPSSLAERTTKASGGRSALCRASLARYTPRGFRYLYAGSRATRSWGATFMGEIAGGMSARRACTMALRSGRHRAAPLHGRVARRYDEEDGMQLDPAQMAPAAV